MTDAAEYERTFTSLNNRLAEHKIQLGKAVNIKGFHIGAKRLAVLAFGVILASVLLFIKMFNIKNKKANYLYLFAIPAAFVPLVMRNIAEKGFALLAAVVFASLGIYFFMTEIKKIYDSSRGYSILQLMSKSTFILIVSIAIALVGAVFENSFLADVKYFLEMDIFRGVKFAQILPFVVFLIIYLIYFINKNNEDPLKGAVNATVKFLNKDIKIYYIVLVGFIGIVSYIYISRTGNESEIQPTNIEMIIRNLLENQLLARPRTKEFLIAFPAIFAAAFAANKKSEFFTFLFMLASAIGTSSVINTFSHIRTPIYLSFARTVIGLFFGIVIGCILILILNYIYKLNMKIQERLK